jgi:hypothetical protein
MVTQYVYELERIWKEAVLALSRYYRNTRLEGLGKTTIIYRIVGVLVEIRIEHHPITCTERYRFANPLAFTHFSFVADSGPERASLQNGRGRDVIRVKYNGGKIKRKIITRRRRNTRREKRIILKWTKDRKVEASGDVSSCSARETCLRIASHRQ